MAKKNGFDLRDPGTKPAKAPRAPSAPPAPKPVTKTPFNTDPRDSIFNSQASQMIQERANQLSSLERDDTYARQDADDSTRRLIEQHAKSLMANKQAQNARGLFYSTVNANSQRDLENSRNDQQAAINSARDRHLSDNELARAEIGRLFGDGTTSNLGAKGLELLQAAIERATQRDAEKLYPEGSLFTDPSTGGKYFMDDQSIKNAFANAVNAEAYASSHTPEAQAKIAAEKKRNARLEREERAYERAQAKKKKKKGKK